MKTILSDSQKHASDSTFDWVPGCFRKQGKKNWHQKRRHAAIARLMRGVAGSVLDYGCGYGDIAYAVSRTNPVQGVDVDPPRVAFAAAEYAPIPFSVCGNSGLDFPDASFDVVLSVVVIHFAADHLAYLRDIRRVLRPGGRLILICRQRALLDNGIRKLLGVKPRQNATWVRPDGGTQLLWIPSRDEMVELLRREGFRLEKEDHFYDPPTEMGLHWRDWPVRIMEQALSLLGVGATANYFCLRLTKEA